MNLWDLKAGLYHSVRSWPLIRNILDRETANLKSLLHQADLHPETVLDIGTGSGSSWRIFHNKVNGFGVDRSRAMLLQARKRIPGLHPVVADALNLPIGPKRVPFISMIGLAEYVRDRERLLSRILEILKPGGWLLLTVPKTSVWNRLRNLLGSPLYIIKESEWESLLEACHFRIVGKTQSLLQIQYLLQLKS